MCLYPRLIENPKYRANKKNGGNVPVMRDRRVGVVPVGCGECIECRKQKSREIQVRLYEEIKENPNGIFVTLTFSTEAYVELMNEAKKETGLDGYDLENAIATLAVRRFTERWRKKHKTSVRHWLITELGHGLTEHMHMHGILWIDPKLYLKGTKNEDVKQSQEEYISERWQYGRVGCGQYVNRRTVNYIAKYVTKIDADHKYYKPKIYASKGIGKGYINSLNASLNKFNGENTKTYYKTTTGHKIALPIYYRNKIYTEEEREQLWLQQLDKEVRYVRGMEIDISNGNDAEYYNALVHHRIKNVEAGYGSGEIDWKRKSYERQRRRWLQRQRVSGRGGDARNTSGGDNNN